jgi:hypothetical protein
VLDDRHLVLGYVGLVRLGQVRLKYVGRVEKLHSDVYMPFEVYILNVDISSIGISDFGLTK